MVSKFKNNNSYFYLANPKHLKLKKEPIDQITTKTNDGFKITLTSTTLQKNVFLHTKVKGHFSDNYFDLMPNQIVLIKFKTDEISLEDLKIKS